MVHTMVFAPCCPAPAPYLQVLAAWKVLVEALASKAPHMLARVVVQVRCCMRW